MGDFIVNVLHWNFYMVIVKYNPSWSEKYFGTSWSLMLSTERLMMYTWSSEPPWENYKRLWLSTSNIIITSMWVTPCTNWMNPKLFRKLLIGLSLFFRRHMLKSPMTTVGLVMSISLTRFSMSWLGLPLGDLYNPMMSRRLCVTFIMFMCSPSLLSLILNCFLKNEAMPCPLPPPHKLTP